MEDVDNQRRSVDFHQGCLHPPPVAPVNMHRRPFDRVPNRFPGSGDDRHKADLGYAIAAKYWGQGITTKAVEVAIPQVFKDFPNLVSLQALADLENKASQRGLEKAGFQKEGVLRRYGYLKGNIKDLVSYSLL